MTRSISADRSQTPNELIFSTDMKKLISLLPFISATFMVPADAQTNPSNPSNTSRNSSGAVTYETIRSVSPALEKYTQTTVLGDLWKRTELNPRDRSIVTLSALVSRNQTSEMDFHFKRALDNGVKPAEISELITHLAFYSGWANATSAVGIASQVFKERNIPASAIPSASPDLMKLNEAADAGRAKGVVDNASPASPGLVHFTNGVLFRDLWLRPDLAPRDRSLVTFSALIATGQVAQIPYHLNRAMDSGLKKEEAQEVVAHLAFYSGWPSAFTAMPVVKDVFAKRAS